MILNNKNLNNKKMSIWGVGIYFALISIIYSIFIIIINEYTKPLFIIKQLSQSVAVIIGIILLFIGIPYFILCRITIYKAYNKGKLAINGVYAMCRHPLYSSWIFLMFLE